MFNPLIFFFGYFVPGRINYRKFIILTNDCKIYIKFLCFIINIGIMFLIFSCILATEETSSKDASSSLIESISMGKLGKGRVEKFLVFFPNTFFILFHIIQFIVVYPFLLGDYLAGTNSLFWSLLHSFHRLWHIGGQ